MFRSFVTAIIDVNTQAGNDTLTVDVSGGDCIPDLGLYVHYSGGLPATGSGDKLVITGNGQGTVTYFYDNANDGSVEMSNFGNVTYSALEPITNTGTATDILSICRQGWGQTRSRCPTTARL